MKDKSYAIRFGLFTGIILIVYFLVLSLFNKHVNPAYSFFNAVITAFGVYEAIRSQKQQDIASFSYGEGFKTGIVTGFVATFVFTAFFLGYATELNSTFLPQLFEYVKGGFGVSVGIVTFVVFIMGLATTVVCTLSVMQLFKNSRNLLQNQ